VVFRRRQKQSWWRLVAEGFWPRAGWRRVINYFAHRIRRLPDTPHKVARGMFAGTLVSILPLPGVQMLAGGLLAWLLRGNILAAVLCSFISNPLTTPFLAVGSIGIGQWILGQDGVLNARMIGHAFAEAGGDLWHNFMAMFTPEVASWTGLAHFAERVFLPYFVGAMVIGLILGMAAYYITIPLVSAYQHRRKGRLKAKLAELRAKAASKIHDKAERGE